MKTIHTIRADAKFQIKGRGLVVGALQSDNLGLPLGLMIGKTVEFEDVGGVDDVGNPRPKLGLSSKQFVVTAVEATQDNFGVADHIGLVVREVVDPEVARLRELVELQDKLIRGFRNYFVSMPFSAADVIPDYREIVERIEELGDE